MGDFDDFLNSLTDEKQKEIMTDSVDIGHDHFRQGYDPFIPDMYNDPQQLKLYINVTSMKMAIKLLKAYDEYLKTND